MRFSLVIPCYNEEKNVPLLLERCRVLGEKKDVEVILVDNGSSDGTRELLVALPGDYRGCRGIRVEENRGYGFGILSGLRAAEGEIVGWTHADLQTDPVDALRGLELFDAHGPDIFVKGRRYGRPFADVVFTTGMSLFETVLMGRRMWDINAQPTMLSRKNFLRWKNPPHDFSLDLYAYYQAHAQKLDIKRFPVRFGERAHGISHWNVNWAAKWKFIHRTIDFSLQLRKSAAE